MSPASYRTAPPRVACATVRQCQRLRQIEAKHQLSGPWRILTVVSDYTIRLAGPAEYEAAGAVTLAAYANDGLIDVDTDYDKELLAAGRRADQAELLVAVNDAGVVVGTVTFCRAGTEYAEISRPGEAEFRMLGVAFQARGSGVGEALVRACIERAVEYGDHALVLSTAAEMTTAHRLYERMGFRRAPGRDWRPLPTIELFAYQLDLPVR